VRVKYYYYVSDAKVEMLYGQIPRRVQERIAAELKINFKFLEISLKQTPNDVTRYSKLQVVCNYLDRQGVGTVHAPGPFFRGSLPMKWGRFPTALEDHADVAFFVGGVGNTLVGLGVAPLFIWLVPPRGRMSVLRPIRASSV
jgi:hypothetical protein